MVSLDPQRGEPDLSKSGQTNFIYEGYLKIPLDFLSKDEALTIINVLLNKVSSIEQNQADTREHPIRGDSVFQSELDKLKSNEFKVSKTKLRACSFCQKRHIFGSMNCEAYGRRCQHCGFKNHSSKACWFLHPELKRVRYFRKPHGMLRSNNGLRKSLSAPGGIDCCGNLHAKVGSFQSASFEQEKAPETTEQHISLNGTYRHPESDSKVVDVLPAASEEKEILNLDDPKERNTLDSGFQDQDMHMAIDITHGHFGFNVSRQVRDKETAKARNIEDQEVKYWNEESWALEQIDVNGDLDWFESEHVKEYYADQGGKILTKFIEKFKQLRKAETEEEKRLRLARAAVYSKVVQQLK